MEASERSLFWIDPRRLADLALSAGAGSPRGAAPDLGLRIGVEARAMAEAAVSEPPVSQAPPTGPGEDTPPAKTIQNLDSTVSDLDFDPPTGTLETRFEALLGWLEGLEECHSAFLVNDEGLALANHGVSDQLLAVSSAICGLLDSLRGGVDLATDGWVTLELESNARLHFSSARSEWGLISVGFLARNLLSSESLSAVRRAFHRTVDDRTE